MAAPIGRGWPSSSPPGQTCSAFARSQKRAFATAAAGRGFTLLEVLAVVFIVGLVLTLAVLSVGHNEDRVLKDEARRIAALLDLARQQAIVESLEMALAVEDDGYRFQVFDGQDWLPMEDDAVLRPRELPDEIELKVEVEGQLVEMMKKAADAAAEKEGEAGEDKEAQEKRKKADLHLTRIFLLSSGEMTPFEIIVRYVDREGAYTVTGNAIGEVKVDSLSKEGG